MTDKPKVKVTLSVDDSAVSRFIATMKELVEYLKISYPELDPEAKQAVCDAIRGLPRSVIQVDTHGATDPTVTLSTCHVVPETA